MDSKNELGADGATVYHSLCATARKTMFERSSGQNPPEARSSNYKEGNEFVSEFLMERTSKKDEIDEITANLKKNFPLKSLKSAKSVKCRRKKTLLTSIEKRKLGLQKLPKKGLKYKSFSALHHLWTEYMKSFLDLNASSVGANQDQLHQRIAKADYHGCLLMVTRSKNPSFIGIRGIVLLETKNTFQIICEDNKIKIIPKRDSIFTFNVSKWTLTLFGNHLNIRPSDRASRKFKCRPTIDL